MTTSEDIIALFNSDDVVLRPSEIIARTRRKQATVRMTLKRLVAKRRLFHIGHSQYARIATAEPIAKMRAGRIAALERRVDEIERLIGIGMS